MYLDYPIKLQVSKVEIQSASIKAIDPLSRHFLPAQKEKRELPCCNSLFTVVPTGIVI